MTDLLTLLIFIALGGIVLCATGWLDSQLEERSPAYTRFWAYAFGETPLPVSNVRVVTTGCCRFCQAIGYHDEGCSNLDRLDAGEVTR